MDKEKEQHDLDELLSSTQKISKEKIKKGKIFCPQCRFELDNRKDPCPHCGYKGYIPLSEEQIKKTRIILFFVILVIAIVIYLIK